MMSSYLSLNIHKENKTAIFKKKTFASPSLLLNSVRHGWISEVFVNLVFPNTRACSVDTYGNRLCKNSHSVCTQRNIHLSALSFVLFYHPKTSPSCKHFMLHLPSSQKENCFPFRSTFFQRGNPNVVPIYLIRFLFEYSSSVPMFAVSAPGSAC